MDRRVAPAELTIHRATSFFGRLGGLLAREPLADTEALYLAPCNSIHTLFMPYVIDVAFLDGDGKVLKVVPGLKPWRMAACRGAAAALELRAGRAKVHGIEPNVVVEGAEVKR